MSGTLPTDPAPSTVSLHSNQPTAVDYSESGKRQARVIGGHLWKAKFSWPRMRRDMLAPIFAFANYQLGRYGSFRVVLPNYATPNGVATGSPQAQGAQSAAQAFVFIDGLTASTTDIIKAGDVFKFTGYDKVYMVTADGDSTAGGNVVALCTPPLIEDIPDNTAIEFHDVEFTMALDDDVVDWKGSAPNMATISLNMTESL